MKHKLVPGTIILLLLAANSVFAQAGAMLNLKEYSSLFHNTRNDLDVKYVMAATDEDWDRFCLIDRDKTDIDTPLEIALLTICDGVRDIRPAEANRMLGTPKQGDLKLGTAVFQEMQVLRFLNDTAAVTRHEAVLQFITSRGNVTRTEIETFYRNGIRALISDVVDEEFNRISFTMDKVNQYSYDTVLAFIPKTGQYALSYERPSVPNSEKTLSANSLRELQDKMRANTADFDQNCVNIVNTQASQIPAVVYDREKTTSGTDMLALIKNTFSNFYINPNQGTYNAIQGILAYYYTIGIFNIAASGAFLLTLSSLSPELYTKATHEVTPGNSLDYLRYYPGVLR